MINRVADTIQRYNLIEPNDGVIVGLSGGPDSVCLLHVLKVLYKGLGAQIFAVHINHMLRGKEADADEEYARELCRSLDVEFYAERVDIAGLAQQKGISLEEAGREVRYAQFEKWAQKLGAAKIAVAHNRNDQVETILMHIIRGTGIDGLKGMEYARGRIIRPLLDIDRSTIEAYCRDNGLEARTDKSNLESVYTRNKVRLELLPYLKEEYNPAIIDSILRMAGFAREDASFLDQTAQEHFISCLIKKEKGLVGLDAGKLSGLHGAIAGRVVRIAIREVKGDVKGIESIHIQDVQALGKGRTGAVLHLPGNLRARLSYGVLEIYFSDEEEAVDYEMSLNMPGTTRAAQAGYLLETKVLHINDIEQAKNIEQVKSIEEAKSMEQVKNIQKAKNIEQYWNIRYNSLEQFFDYDKLASGVCLRNRRDGDVFKPLKGKGTKKLKDYFIDIKVPRHKRKQFPLIAKNNEIVWIVGHKISDKFKVTENTNNVLHIKFFKL